MLQGSPAPESSPIPIAGLAYTMSVVVALHYSTLIRPPSDVPVALSRAAYEEVQDIALRHCNTIEKPNTLIRAIIQIIHIRNDKYGNWQQGLGREPPQKGNVDHNYRYDFEKDLARRKYGSGCIT